MPYNIFLNKINTVKFNISTFHIFIWEKKKKMDMVLNNTVYLLLNVSPSCKFEISVQKKRKWWFHHLEMNYYLHENILYWKFILSFIRWNRSIYIIIMLDVSCQLVRFLITSSQIWSGTSLWNTTRKKLIVFFQIFRTK